MALWINEEGLFKINNKKLIFIFDEAKLELLICGYNKIYVDDWIAHTVYDENHNIIKFFWSVVREFSGEERRNLLRFVTKSNRVPFGGLYSLQVDYIPCQSNTKSNFKRYLLSCFTHMFKHNRSTRIFFSRNFKEKLLFSMTTLNQYNKLF